MHVLALQPYDTGAHRAFLEGWRRNSRHTFDVLALPGRHFKWRMRQAPIDLAQQTETLVQSGLGWDALWCTSMLDLATCRGLCPAVARLPAAVYFHENQLTYPTRYADQRDLHFGLTQMMSALAAIASCKQTDVPCVWWNSAYNRDSFLEALDALLHSMPDHRPTRAVQQIRDASAVVYPGIDPIEAEPSGRDAPPILIWAARWEHDKAPELFFEALDELKCRGVEFRVSVIGQQFAEYPACFDVARERFADRIVRWGYQPSRAAYAEALKEADIVVSTAKHEFFGLAVAEAVSAGCVPMLPGALAYPEVWGDAAVYHDQSATGIADAIERALARCDTDVSQTAGRFAWARIAPQIDNAIESIVCLG